MRTSNEVDHWQRHYVIAQSLTAFFELELKYPAVAAMAQSGIINERPDYGHEFKEGDGISEILEGVFGGEPLGPEAEAENQAWRDFIKAICGLAGQVFYASFDSCKLEKRESPSERTLREHGEVTISMIVTPYWRSLGRYGTHWIYDERLRDLVLDFVRQAEEREDRTPMQLESANA